MWIKLCILISISVTMITYGIFWLMKSFYSKNCYDFTEDFRKSFLVVHWSYAGFFNDKKPRRIIPILLIIGGLGVLGLELIRYQSIHN